MFKALLIAVLSTLIPIYHGKLALKNLLTYKKYSYTTFTPWNLHGELTFVFRTNQSDGMLLYQDDGIHDFIELFLENGNVRLKIGVGDCQIQERSIRGRFNDLHWHRVRLTRQAGNVTLSADTSWATLPCSPAKVNRFVKAGGRFMYVASFPPSLGLNLNWLVFPGTFHQAMRYSFEGCLGDLWFTDSEERLDRAKLHGSSGTSHGCDDACAIPDLNKCQHESRCSDEIGRVECECQGTGYEGKTCSAESSSAWFNGSGYVSYDVGVHQPGRSTLHNTIAFRFATGSPDGVILHTIMDDDHAVVELTGGFMRISWDLGQGKLNVTSREGCLHDGTWHTVTIRRTRRRVTLDVDNQRRVTSVIPGDFSFLDFKGGLELLLFCGGPDPDTLVHSDSRKNFSGIIQQLRFDEYRVLDEVFAKRIHKEFIAVGEVVNASALLNKVPQQPLPLPNCTRIATVPPVDPCGGASVDDEDLCETAASGLGPDHPGCDTTDGRCSMPGTEEKEAPSVVTIFSASANTSSSMTSQNEKAKMEVRTLPAQLPVSSSTHNENTANAWSSSTTEVSSEVSAQSTAQESQLEFETLYYLPTSSQTMEPEFLPTPALPTTTELTALRVRSEELKESRYHVETGETEIRATRTVYSPMSTHALLMSSVAASVSDMRSNGTANVTVLAQKSVAPHATQNPNSLWALLIFMLISAMVSILPGHY